MLKLGLGIDKSVKKITAGTTIDPDATAFFNRVTAAGGSLSATEQSAINTLVLDLKGYSIWTSMKAIYPMVGASAAACSQNLINASFTGTFSSGWTFASTGVNGNGVSAYMDTSLNDLNDLGTNASIGIYLNNTGNNLWDLGVYSAPNVSGISIANTSATNYINIRTALVSNFTEAYTGGFYFGTADGTNSNVYKNSTNRATQTQNNNGINLIHCIGALNISGTPSLFTSTRIALALFANQNFTSINVTNLYTAVQAFNTTLTRQI